MEKFKFITDMDGTLYSFKNGARFSTSDFGRQIREGSLGFVMERLGLSFEDAEFEYERIKSKYGGHFSLGIENEHGIDRYEFFSNTWNLDAAAFIDPSDISESLEILRGRIALLTAAPRVWANNVLAHLNISDLFGDHVYTGEPDIRKPDPEIFRNIATNMGASPEMVFSIGDQEESDIIPARSIGMRTVLIGSMPDSSADYQASDISSAIKILTAEGFI